MMDAENKKEPEPMPQVSKALLARKHQAGAAIQRHFNGDADAVIIASVSHGRLQVDITPFASLGEMTLTKAVLDRSFNETLERSLASAPPQDQTPSEQVKSDESSH
jgi:hypothetical protein